MEILETNNDICVVYTMDSIECPEEYIKIKILKEEKSEEIKQKIKNEYLLTNLYKFLSIEEKIYKTIKILQV